jgi:hypothetical protein
MNRILLRIRQRIETDLESGGNPKNASRSLEVRAFLGIFAAWLLVVVTVALKHEMWRDEVQPLSVAISVNSPWAIIQALTDHGHPGLWHLILYFAYGAFQNMIVLQVIGICIAALFVILFLFRAPFPLWFKTLFVFGVFPLYEYSVMVRSYGLSMLLFFIFATLYEKRQDHRLLLGFLLALLANTTVHSMIMAGLLTAVWLRDEYCASDSKSIKSIIKECGPGIIVAAAGATLAIITIWPQHSIIPAPVELNFNEIASSSLKNFLLPGRNFLSIFPTQKMFILGGLMPWVLALGLRKRLHYGLAIVAGFALIGIFADLVYAIDLRHQGVVYAFVVCLYWMSQGHLQRSTNKATREGFLKNPAYFASIFLIFPIIMGNHLYYGIKSVAIDLREQRSSSRAFGQFINDHPEFHDAIIMAEPDYVMESLPYYASNPIYLLREGKFEKFFRLTTASKSTVGLGELLRTARMLKVDEKKPVLIALATKLIEIDESPAKEVKYTKFRTFTWSIAELADFRASTQKITEFTSASTDENYRIYQLK